MITIIPTADQKLVNDHSSQNIPITTPHLKMVLKMGLFLTVSNSNLTIIIATRTQIIVIIIIYNNNLTS